MFSKRHTKNNNCHDTWDWKNCSPARYMRDAKPFSRVHSLSLCVCFDVVYIIKRRSLSKNSLSSLSLLSLSVSGREPVYRKKGVIGTWQGNGGAAGGSSSLVDVTSPQERGGITDWRGQWSVRTLSLRANRYSCVKWGIREKK